MNDSLVAITAGVGLVLVGLSFLRWNIREWREAKNSPLHDDHDREHYYKRFRRRVQTTSLLILVGVLIPVGDWLIIRGKNPLVATVYWCVVLLLIVWIVLLAFADMVATRMYSRVELSKIQQKKRELERQLTQIKSRNSNGHAN
ncbi:hypothetical protein [Thalassoroseus pseudoceratinae]|uniref:hypothetical protein n=1 Tax=Thalassoroseus pseudoceratinae TaxID=2713176 RepID=UPI00141FA93B|nr:hypothetical protein [Thalassoroseus pseudoceratinae]